MMLTSNARPVLTLADLEAFDPHAPEHGVRRRFLCPVPACVDKPRDRSHRSLSLEVATGLWKCWRCGASGQLREHWQPQPAGARAVARRAFTVVPAAASPAPRPTGARMGAPAASDADWRAQLEMALPVTNGPGSGYLHRRGIPSSLAAAAGVRYSSAWYGRPAVLFPLHDQAGQLMAVNGRHTDSGSPKAHTGGDRRLGVFATPGALRSDLLVITEAPLDALSLAMCGLPAIALCGTSWPEWLPAAAAFRQVLVALDADAAGDKAAGALRAALLAFGARVERLRPADAAKDWNGVLQDYGTPLLRWTLRQPSPAPLAWDEAVAEDLLAALFNQQTAQADHGARPLEQAREEARAWQALNGAVASAYAARDIVALSQAISAYEMVVWV